MRWVIDVENGSIHVNNGYLGGTYVSQVEAEDNIQDIKLWIENLAIDEIEDFY